MEVEVARTGLERRGVNAERVVVNAEAVPKESASSAMLKSFMLMIVLCVINVLRFMQRRRFMVLRRLWNNLLETVVVVSFSFLACWYSLRKICTKASASACVFFDTLN